jgi:hypothetical protein
VIKAFVDAEFAEKFAPRTPRKTAPRVQVETPAPPAIREDRIGKEAAAGIVPSCVFLSTRNKS